MSPLTGGCGSKPYAAALSNHLSNVTPHAMGTAGLVLERSGLVDPSHGRPEILDAPRQHIHSRDVHPQCGQFIVLRHNETRAASAQALRLSARSSRFPSSSKPV